jgi:excinuclease ABC subunit C
MLHFGRLDNIKKATVAELAAVSGMSEKLAQTVYDFFHAEA